jgi:hypothetical protein
MKTSNNLLINMHVDPNELQELLIKKQPAS